MNRKPYISHGQYEAKRISTPGTWAHDIPCHRVGWKWVAAVAVACVIGWAVA